MHRVFAIAAFVALIAGLALTVPAAIEAGGGGHGQCVPAPRDGHGEPVVIEGNCYEPAVLYVQPGAIVEWQQRDVIPHNVTLFGGDLIGSKANMVKGEAVTRQFDGPGVFAYYCSVHPSMIGVVVVGEPASEGFGATLELQTTAQELRAIADYKQEWLTSFQQANPIPGQPTSMLDAGKGNNSPGNGTGWGEAAVGLGLFGGLVVGLVAAGGGIRLLRRGRL
jgi:plastocyanin